MVEFDEPGADLHLTEGRALHRRPIDHEAPPLLAVHLVGIYQADKRFAG